MNFLKSILTHKVMLWNLIRNDFKNRYLGNHLGIVWAFVQPLVMVAIYWFVFVHGFKNTPINNVPFLLWLLAGMVPWFLLGDAILSSSNAIVDQSFLVKKIVFEVKLLPVVKIGSALLVNLAFWLLMIIVAICYGYYPSWAWLQLVYYMFCILAFVLSLSLMLSALVVFLRDVGQIVGITMQMAFWITPVMWNSSILHNKLIWIVKLNPFAYVINGFRQTIIYNTPFWLNWPTMIYFWCLTLGMFWLGNKVFNKLRPHFADVL